jgi:peptide/nickel transport system substrate-binding protein
MLSLILGACKTATPTEGPAPTSPPDVQPTDAPPEPTSEPEPVVMRIGREGDLVDCLNIALCGRGYNAWEVLYDGLVDWAEEGMDGVVGRLAESWEISEDGMTWTFHLRDLTNATFHDGTPLTAEAIAWSLNYIAFNDAISWLYGAYIDEGFGAEVVDDQTVVLQLLEPMNPDILLNYLVYVHIFPQHIWEQYDSESIYVFENIEAIGTGPYKLAEWEPGQYMIFDAHDGHVMGRPPVDRIIIQTYATQDGMIQALIAGEIDAIMNLDGIAVETLTAIPEITVFEKSPLYEHHIYFNMWESGLRNSAIEDKVVRQAIAHAIDKQQIVDVVFGGRAVASDSYWDGGLRWERWAHPTLEAHTFDLELATGMLEDAGYVDSDRDGVREMNDGSGEPLTLRLFFENDSSVQLSMAEMVRTWVSGIGIDLQLESLEPATLTDAVLSGDFDLGMSVYGFDWDPDYNVFWLTSYALDWGLNWPGYANPDFDDLYLAQFYAATDEERNEYLYLIQEHLHEEVPWIQLQHFNVFDAYRNDKFEFTIQNSMWESWHWWGIYGVEVVE